MNIKLLGIYLNDHLAGSVTGLELARRAARENPGTPLGAFLTTLSSELEQDQAVIEQVLRALNVPRDRIKQSAAWAMERLGRLKLNGRLMSYSPLSRMLELEGLFIGSQGRRAMWRALRRLARTERRLASFDFEALLARTELHLQELERWRLQAADTAFTKARALPGSLTPAQSQGR